MGELEDLRARVEQLERLVAEVDGTHRAEMRAVNAALSSTVRQVNAGMAVLSKGNREQADAVDAALRSVAAQTTDRLRGLQQDVQCVAKFVAATTTRTEPPTTP